MFGFLKKDPIKRLEKSYYTLLEKGRGAQKSGDDVTYAKIMLEAENVLVKIEQLKAE